MVILAYYFSELTVVEFKKGYRNSNNVSYVTESYPDSVVCRYDRVKLEYNVVDVNVSNKVRYEKLEDVVKYDEECSEKDYNGTNVCNRSFYICFFWKIQSFYRINCVFWFAVVLH